MPLFRILHQRMKFLPIHCGRGCRGYYRNRVSFSRAARGLIEAWTRGGVVKISLHGKGIFSLLARIGLATQMRNALHLSIRAEGGFHCGGCKFFCSEEHGGALHWLVIPCGESRDMFARHRRADGDFPPADFAPRMPSAESPSRHSCISALSAASCSTSIAIW